jgi:hypothetical protein
MHIHQSSSWQETKTLANKNYFPFTINFNINPFSQTHQNQTKMDKKYIFIFLIFFNTRCIIIMAVKKTLPI